MIPHSDANGRLVRGVLLASLGLLCAPELAAQLSAYTVPPDNSRRAATNFNVETIRGMAIDEPAGRLYAINTHGSTLVYFTNASAPDPAASFRTLNNPSALALYDRPGGGSFALVVGGGTHGVALHDRNTGFIEGYLPLPSEPMDIVVDHERDLAFVSCGGAYDKVTQVPGQPKVVESGGVVVEIDLISFRESARHFIPAARPMFLDIEELPGEGDNVVHVAAHLSGNGTTVRLLTGNKAEAEVVRRDEPDQDVFAIDEAGNVTTYIENAGTLLTGHHRHPNGTYWVLGVDSINHQFKTEPEHRGRFAENRITLRASTGVVTTMTLDDVPQDADKPASFPIDVGFHDLSGLGFITSSTGDVVRIVDSNGRLVRTVPLPEGAIPRSIIVTDDVVWVYGWGRNEIYGFDITAIVIHGNFTPAATLKLGHDPLPAAVKRGRQIWYDADRSRDSFATPAIVGKVSCNTCHPRGGMDLLAWHLEDGVLDRKDVMVTQSLFSSEDTFPYHWRGERALSDFNGAFPALLGGPALGTAVGSNGSSELADFEAFVFSLQGAANPRQHIDRMLDDAKTLQFVESQSGTNQLLTGIPSAGQSVFHNDTNVLTLFNPIRCVQCHGAESGSNGIIQQDVLSVLPTQISSDVAHLRQLGHKLLQKIGPAKVNNVPIGDRPQGGFGLSQDGDDPDIIHFFDAGAFFTAPPNPTVADLVATQQQRINAAAFVAQFDEGIAPRAHQAVWYDASAASQLQLMIRQASNGDFDLTVMAFASPIVLSMWFDPATQRFHTMKPGQPGDYSDDIYGLQAAHGNGVGLLFVGVPPGNGFRFAVDQDNDGLAGQLEIALGTDPLAADSDGDGYPDGYEHEVNLAHPGLGIDPTVFNTQTQMESVDVDLPQLQQVEFDYVSGRISKHFVTFSEPVTYTVQVERLVNGTFAPFGPLQRHGAARTTDTLVAHGLFPTVTTPEEYRLVVTMTDLARHSSTAIISGAGGASLKARPTVFPFAGLDEAFTTSNVKVRRLGPQMFDVTLDVETLNGVSNGKFVLLQVLAFDPATSSFVRVSNVGARNGARASSQLDFGTPTALNAWWGTAPGAKRSNPVVPGPFVLSAPISSGAAMARITLPSTPIGTRCRVIVLGVFDEVGPLSGGPFTPPRAQDLDNRHWLMPLSPQSGRSADFTVN
ncbi:MAG: hypothetical protein KDC98_09965 [Planctomycetes bacterium]|nr:hypothetical protein [Planctomycetota bacterium]